jgi:hypothetical protein
MTISKFTNILAINLLIVFSSAAQNNSTTNIDFLKYVTRYTPSTSGKISCGPICKDGEKIIGLFDGYLIHKNGGDWWYQEAKRRFPNEKGTRDRYLSHYTVAERLLKEDKDSLKNYNKWVYFIDIKDLFVTTEKDGDTGKDMLAVYPTFKKPIEVIMYQQIAGERVWREVDRKICQTLNEFTDWESSFIKKKIAESNLPK